MTVWVTADLHFGHTNILKFSPQTRPFRDVDHMNESLITEWNSQVRDEDTVYILGDVAFCSVEKACMYIKQLRGHKILIEGNHDRKLVQNSGARNLFDEIHIYHTIKHAGHRVCMFHFPIAEWDQCHRGSLHIHGHSHGNYRGGDGRRMMDVGVDATGNVVTRLDDVVEQLSRRVFTSHHNQSEDNVYA